MAASTYVSDDALRFAAVLAEATVRGCPGRVAISPRTPAGLWVHAEASAGTIAPLDTFGSCERRVRTSSDVPDSALACTPDTRVFTHRTRRFSMRLILTTLSAALILVSVAGATSVARPKSTLQGPRLTFVPAPKVDFKLRLASQTRTKVTFTWRRQRGIDGYRFLRNGVVVSRTFDRSTRSATFWKGSRYAVEGLQVIRGGGHAKPVRRASAVANAPKGRQRFVFHSALSIDFRLRLVSETAKTITFAWKRQPLADGFSSFGTVWSCRGRSIVRPRGRPSGRAFTTRSTCCASRSTSASRV